MHTSFTCRAISQSSCARCSSMAPTTSVGCSRRCPRPRPRSPGPSPCPGAPLWRRELVLPRGRVGAALGGLAGVRLLPTGGVRARGVVRRGTGAESGRRVQLPPHPPRRTRAADADRASLLRGPYVAAAAVAHVFPVRLFQATRRAQGGARDDAAAARPEPVPHGLGGEWPGRPLVATRGRRRGGYRGDICGGGARRQRGRGAAPRPARRRRAGARVPRAARRLRRGVPGGTARPRAPAAQAQPRARCAAHVTLARPGRPAAARPRQHVSLRTHWTLCRGATATPPLTSSVAAGHAGRCCTFCTRRYV